MSEITKEMIDKAIKECYWRKVVDGVGVCGGMLAPCSRTIEKGQCETLINLYRNRKEGDPE